MNKYTAITIIFIMYYIFCAFVLYGNYHIVIELGKSKWWLLSLVLLAASPSLKSEIKD